MTTEYSINPEPTDPNAITLDTDTNYVSIYTLDGNTGVDYTVPSPTTPVIYTVKVWLRTESGSDKNDQADTIEFTVTIEDLCHSASVTIGA